MHEKTVINLISASIFFFLPLELPSFKGCKYNAEDCSRPAEITKVMYETCIFAELPDFSRQVNSLHINDINDHQQNNHQGWSVEAQHRESEKWGSVIIMII